MTRHLIGDLVFDLTVDSGNRVMRDEDHLRRLVTHTMLPVLESALDAFDDGDTHLVVPVLELDLGVIGQADYDSVAPARLRAALEDALHRARAAARAPIGAGSGDGCGMDATVVPRADADLAQLERFLATGTLPWHAQDGSPRLHEALLARLLEAGGAGLWAALARALAAPHSAQRLVTQFPVHQLLAIVRGVGGAGMALPDDALAPLPPLPPHGWLQVLGACLEGVDGDAAAARARIRAVLAAMHAAPASSDAERLLSFLDTGTLTGDASSGEAAHASLLGRLLATGSAALWRTVARALADPRRARRFVAQFGVPQRAAVLQAIAGAGAAAHQALLAQVPPDDLDAAWVAVLSAPHAGAATARLLAMLPQHSDTALLARYLDTGVLTAVGEDGDLPAHAALLARLLARDDDDAALWTMLRAQLAEPRRARRFLEQFTAPQRLAVLRGMAGAAAEHYEILLAEARQLRSGSAAAPIDVWMQVLAAVTGPAPHDSAAHCARIRAAYVLRGDAALPAQDGAVLQAALARAAGDPDRLRRFVLQTPEPQRLTVLRRVAGAQAPAFEALLADLRGGARNHDDTWIAVLGAAGAPDAGAACARLRGALPGDTDLLLRYLDTGTLPAGLETDGAPAHTAVLERLLAAGRDALWPVLARALAAPRSARRFVAQFPVAQRLAVLRGIAAADTQHYEALLAEAGQWPAIDGAPAQHHAWIAVLAAAAGPVVQEVAAVCARIRLAYAPQAMLVADALLARDDSVVAALFAQPDGTRRFVAQSSQAQRLTALRRLAGADAWRFEATLADARAHSDDLEGAWVAVLSACAQPDAAAACIRIRATFAPSRIDTDRRTPSDIALMVRYLERDVMDRAIDGSDAPTPAALLGRLLENDCAWPVLAQALAAPHRARRFVERYPEAQCRAVLRRIAGRQAWQFEALVQEADASPEGRSCAWAAILAAGLAPDAAAACGRIRAALTAGGAPAHGLSRPDAALLVQYLDGGGAGGTTGAHLLERLLSTAGTALRPALAQALAEPRRARRFVVQFQAPQRLAVLRVLAGAGAAQYGALLDAARSWPSAGGEAASTVAWLAVLAACTGAEASATAAHCARIRAALAPGAAHAGGEARSGAALLARYLDSGQLPGRATPATLLRRLLSLGSGAVRTVLAPLLAEPRVAGRLAAHFTRDQRLAVLRGVAGPRAAAYETLLAQALPRGGAGLETTLWTQVLVTVAASGDIDDDAACARILSACDAAPPAPGTMLPLQRFAQFLATGVWRRAATPDAHVALLDELLTRPGANLWRVLARALEREDSAARLLVQFPPRQHLALMTASAPASAPALAQLLTRMPVQDPATQQWWRHALAVCTARPVIQAVPARVAARVALGGSVPAPAPPLRLRRIDRHADSGTGTRAVPWRADAGERHAARALTRVAALAAPYAAAMREALGSMAFAGAAALPDAGLALRARTQIARDLIAACGDLESGLQAGAAGALASAREAVVARIDANPAIAPQRRAQLCDAIDAKTAEMANPASFLRRLLAALLADAPLDLDALAQATPVDSLAAALRAGDAATVHGQWQALMRDHAPQVRAAWQHYSRSPPVRRALEQALPDALLRALDSLPDAAAPAVPPRPEAQVIDAPAPAAHAAAQPSDTTDLVAVANAGMVLAAPYLPRLFGALNLLADGAFIDAQAAARAVHLLQYMVTGEAATPEYQLVLGKILCGLPTAAPVPAGIAITQAEQDMIEGLIAAMVAHAKVLGTCSVGAMRQTFLARQGDVQLVDDAWQLRVHPGPFDMLLDRLPWGYSIVKFGWMARPVHVTWRPA